VVMLMQVTYPIAFFEESSTPKGVQHAGFNPLSV
jgi:hypothetical protein